MTYLRKHAIRLWDDMDTEKERKQHEERQRTIEWRNDTVGFIRDFVRFYKLNFNVVVKK